MSLELSLIIFASIANMLLGIIVVSRDPKKTNNRIFGLISATITFWIVFNYLADNAQAHNLLYTRLTYLSIIWVIYYIVKLSLNFPIKNKISNRLYAKVQLPLAIIVSLLCISPFFVLGVTLTEDGVNLDLSNLYFVFIVYLAQSIILLAYSFISQYRDSKSTEQRSLVRLLATGILLYASFAIMSNLVLPSVLDTWSTSKYGPIFTLFLVGVTAYAIIWRGLFDIRPVIARSIAYALSLLSVLFVYSGFAFLLANNFKSLGVTVEQSLFFAIFSAIIALLFQPVKQFFDKVSNKLFYRDAYDPQQVINSINSTLVSTIDLKKQLLATGRIIQDELKLSYVAFCLNPRKTNEYHLATPGARIFGESDWVTFADAFKKISTKSTLVGDEQISYELQSSMKELHIEGALKMISGGDDVGYLMIGERKSGNSFTKQDVQLLEIIANEVAIAVQNALRFEEISAFNVTLQKKIEDATSQLKRSNEKLKALDEAKDDFVSMASHQLRTPLTSVKGYLSMVLEGDAGELNEQQRSMLDQAFTSSQRMTYLIADLLNLSRLKTGKFVIDNNPTNLVKVITQELSQVEATAEARKLTIAYEEPAVFPTMMLDETKIRQVIMNFVDNAIYYTPGGGEITVKLEELDKSIEFTVHDNGIGVPAADQHNLFTKFYRAANAKQARPDGTGLGLFMARKVIVAQGGATIFRSQIGKGSTFGFSFPKTLATNEPAKKT